MLRLGASSRPGRQASAEHERHMGVAQRGDRDLERLA
jgi:hypothetical protein